jgi:hypothetical protein
MYRSSHPPYVALNLGIPGTFGLLRPDIRDDNLRHVAEIKPLSPWGRYTGPVQLGVYLAALNGTQVTWRGRSWLLPPYLGGGWQPSMWQVQPQPLVLPPQYSNWTVFLLGNTGGIVYYGAFPNQRNVTMTQAALARLTLQFQHIMERFADGLALGAPDQIALAYQQMSQVHALQAGALMAATGAVAVGVAARSNVNIMQSLMAVMRF